MFKSSNVNAYNTVTYTNLTIFISFVRKCENIVSRVWTWENITTIKKKSGKKRKGLKVVVRKTSWIIRPTQKGKITKKSPNHMQKIWKM